MLTEFKNSIPTVYPIHPQFPVDKLIDAFDSYLHDFLIYRYSINPSLKFKCEKNLTFRLVRFNRLNPSFGRKIYTRSSGQAIESRV